MANDWIIDVLADLRTYAGTNGLNALAERLDEATLVAAAEIASRGDCATDGTQFGTTHRQALARPIARRSSNALG